MRQPPIMPSIDVTRHGGMVSPSATQLACRQVKRITSRQPDPTRRVSEIRRRIRATAVTSRHKSTMGDADASKPVANERPGRPPARANNGFAVCWDGSSAIVNTDHRSSGAGSAGPLITGRPRSN